MELVSVTCKLLIPEVLGVFEVQKVNAVFAPDDKIGTANRTTAGCTS